MNIHKFREGFLLSRCECIVSQLYGGLPDGYFTTLKGSGLSGSPFVLFGQCHRVFILGKIVL